MRNLWLVLLAAGAAAQQPNPVLTLADCWRLAEGQFSLVERARQDELSAAEQIRQARAGFLPQFAYQNAFTYNTPRIGDRSAFSYVALNGVREYVTQSTITEEIDVSGRLRASLERGRAELAAAQARTAIARRDLRLAVREAYYAALEARHNAEAAQRVAEEAEAFARRTRLMAEQGEAARADVVKAEAQLAARKRELYAAEAAARNAALALKSFWSEDLSEPPQIEDSFFQVPEAQDYRGWQPNWILRRAEFSLLEAAEKAARADARAARSERRPAFGVAYAYGLDANQIRIGERGQAVFATLHVPLFDWHRSRSRERQAELLQRQIQIDRQISRRLFTGVFFMERNNVDLAVQQVAEGRREVDFAREALRLARLRYDGGEGTALEVVDAMNVLAAAEIAYHHSVFRYHVSRARLEAAVGQ